MGALSFWPRTLDIGKAGTNLFLGENVRETRHVAAVTRRRVPARLQTVADDLDQDRVRVMPGVPAGIVWRCRQAAVFAAFTPGRLTFQICAVTARTVLGINALPDCQQPSVIRVDQWRSALPSAPRDRRDEKGDTGRQQRAEYRAM